MTASVEFLAILSFPTFWISEYERLGMQYTLAAYTRYNTRKRSVVVDRMHFGISRTYLPSIKRLVRRLFPQFKMMIQPCALYAALSLGQIEPCGLSYEKEV